ncbi:MAG: UDP-3-O-(3-hydroxymyristoyl)glucosamine N-acyltransferase [Fimbriimonadales bacterium]
MDQSALTHTLEEIARIVDGQLHGPGDLIITDAVPAGDSGPSAITFAESPEYLAYVEASDVAAVLVANDVESSKPYIRCQNPRRAFVRILATYIRELPVDSGIHETALVSEDARIHPDAKIGAYCVIERGVSIDEDTKVYPFCYIGEQCKIGKSCRIYPHATLYQDVSLGDRTIIHAGSVLGADGFGYYFDAGTHKKIPQVGGVIIGDDCEIGALSAVDRAMAGNTQIGDGTKLDNFVQIAHNVRVGKHTVMAAQAGIGGSTEIGEYNIFAGQSGASDHVKTPPGCTFAGRTAVTRNISEPGAYWGNLVPRKAGEEKRIQIALGKLPELIKRVRELEDLVQQLQKESGK